MNWQIEPATREILAERVGWRYDPPYDFYDDDGEPVNNPERFYAVRTDAGTLVGFYYFEQRGDAIFYGLGLRPDLTGRGLGLDFVKRGIEFARELFGERRIVLDVAKFNVRAQKVYERAGFVRTGEHVKRNVVWVDMELVE